MMALPHTQYVIAEASTPVSGVNSNQVKTVSECCLIDENDQYLSAGYLHPRSKKIRNEQMCLWHELNIM